MLGSGVTGNAPAEHGSALQGGAQAAKPASLVQSTPNKKPAFAGFLPAANSNRNQRFIEPKNSSLDLVFFILSSKNSIAAISSIGCSPELFEDFVSSQTVKTLFLRCLMNYMMRFVDGRNASAMHGGQRGLVVKVGVQICRSLSLHLSRVRKYLKKRLLAGPNLQRQNPIFLGQIAHRCTAKPSLPEGFAPWQNRFPRRGSSCCHSC